MPDDSSKSQEETIVKRDTSYLGELPKRPLMPAEEVPAPTTAARLAPPWRILLQIVGQSQTTVGIEVRDKITIGRSDPVANFYPELDLAPYGGQPHGVSRRHAQVTQGEDHKALYIEDLGSANGTRINGFALEPRRRYRLRDGDELEFGSLQTVLKVVRAPLE